MDKAKLGDALETFASLLTTKRHVMRKEDELDAIIDTMDKETFGEYVKYVNAARRAADNG